MEQGGGVIDSGEGEGPSCDDCGHGGISWRKMGRSAGRCRRRVLDGNED